MTFAWFVSGRALWHSTRDRVVAAWRQSALWRGGRAIRRVARRGLDRLLALKDRS